MAKRKKKHGGGAFGSGKKPLLPMPRPSPGPIMSVRDSERMNRMIQKIIASKDFESLEDMQRFVNDNIVGRKEEELEAMLPGDGPETGLERAQRLIDDIPEGTLPEEVIRIAKQALALSEDCMGAWFEYGVHAEDTATALERFEKGIARGRERFNQQIAECGEGHGLWGWLEARDFMRLLEEKGKALEELGELERAAGIYQEMLALNPNDNQGIRGDLLRLLMIQRRLEDSRKLLDRFPEDAMVDMVYGRAFLETVETVDRLGFEVPDADAPGAPESPAAFLKDLGPEFHAAKKLLNLAVKMNPFVPIFMTHGSLLDVEIEDLATVGGPYEAVVYAQRWCSLWYVSGVPFLMLAGAPVGSPKKLTKSRHTVEELADVLEQLEDYDALGDAPWWDAFDREP